jgi:hypothetical protein
MQIKKEVVFFFFEFLENFPHANFLVSRSKVTSKQADVIEIM